jgi:hypothetical protein
VVKGDGKCKIRIIQPWYSYVFPRHSNHVSFGYLQTFNLLSTSIAREIHDGIASVLDVGSRAIISVKAFKIISRVTSSDL